MSVRQSVWFPAWLLSSSPGLTEAVEPPALRKGNHPGDFPGSETLGYEQNYHGLVVSAEKRFSDNGSLMGSYTWSRSVGLIPTMFSQGQFNHCMGAPWGVTLTTTSMQPDPYRATALTCSDFRRLSDYPLTSLFRRRSTSRAVVRSSKYDQI